MTSRTHRSVCPFDCPDTCGLLVEVQGSRAVRVSGDSGHPYTRGFLCPKMAHYEQTVHAPDRLITPLIRTGAKGAGQFRSASWAEAIQTIASRFQGIIAAYGGEAILPYSYAGTMGLIQRNAGHPFFHKLGASRLERTICSPAKDVGWKAVMGDTPSCDPDDVTESDLVILWGINAAATNIHFLPSVQKAKRSGAEVWLIDTYETPTASVADRSVLVRPGSDGALALGMMHVIACDNLLDHEFITRHVQGYEELAAQVLPGYHPERVAALTGLDAETIRDLARCFATARQPFIRLGSSLSRYGNGAMTVRTIACLPALTGAYARKGGGCFPGTSTGSAFNMAAVTREDFMAKPSRIVNMNRLGHALNELADPPVMGLYVYHSNPAAITPDQNSVLRGLAREDLFTVVHERFMTDTAAWADVVLPATSSLEHADIYRSYGTYYVQQATAVIPPVGESRSNRQVFALLAQAMGIDDEFFGLSEEELIARLIAQPSPLWDNVDKNALKEGRAIRLNAGFQRNNYQTPSGMIEIFNPREEHTLPVYLPTHEEQGTHPLRLMTAPNLYCLNSSFNEQEELRKKQEGMLLLMNPADAGHYEVMDGERVIAFNNLGEVEFILRITEKTPAGVVVAEGVWWMAHAPGSRTVNALTSQRLTDQGKGSTFYDNRVGVRKKRDGGVSLP